MEYVLFAVAIAAVIFLFFRVRALEAKVADMGKVMADAEDIIKEHAELERQTVNSERLFQEGLQNILGYGVTNG